MYFINQVLWLITKLSSIVHLDAKKYFTLIYSEELSEFTHICTQAHSHANAYTQSTYLNVCE